MTKAKHYTDLLKQEGILKSEIARVIFPKSSHAHSSLCNWFNGRVRNPSWHFIDLAIMIIKDERKKRKKIKNKC